MIREHELKVGDFITSFIEYGTGYSIFVAKITKITKIQKALSVVHGVHIVKRSDSNDNIFYDDQVKEIAQLHPDPYSLDLINRVWTKVA